MGLSPCSSFSIWHRIVRRAFRSHKKDSPYYLVVMKFEEKVYVFWLCNELVKVTWIFRLFSLSSTSREVPVLLHSLCQAILRDVYEIHSFFAACVFLTSILFFILLFRRPLAEDENISIISLRKRIIAKISCLRLKKYTWSNHFD